MGLNIKGTRQIPLGLLNTGNIRTPTVQTWRFTVAYDTVDECANMGVAFTSTRVPGAVTTDGQPVTRSSLFSYAHREEDKEERVLPCKESPIRRDSGRLRSGSPT